VRREEMDAMKSGVGLGARRMKRCIAYLGQAQVYSLVQLRVLV
jgi:hypothetical protein